MPAEAWILLRRDLRMPVPPPRWPVGISLAAFDPVRHAGAVHSLLSEAYTMGGGVVGSLESWWAGLRDDAEYTPALVLLAVTAPEAVIGVAHCWTNGFVKDLVVAVSWRRQGIGEALLTHAFEVFRGRGVENVDLKVEADNAEALRFYDRLEMRRVPPR